VAGGVQWGRITEILEMVRGRWAVHLLRYLASGVSRPADLLDSVNADASATLGRTLSNKVMFDVLRRLAGLGLVSRVAVAGGRPETHYWLTSSGHGILADVSKIGASDLSRFPLAAEDPAAPPHFGAAPVIARYVRQFQASAVDRLLQRGVRQFLDIGTGLPVAGSVHEVAQQSAPESRVVYVDADLREPGKILARASRTLDLARPVAVLLLGVLHFIPDDDDPWGIVARLLDGITGDAYLVIAHAADDLNPPEIAEAARRYNERSPVPFGPRSRPQIARFFSGSGMQMLPPGLVPLGRWWPDPAGDDTPDSDTAGYVGIGWRPAWPPRRT
jgi:DNA-binding HxlR family transcriptional regulator